jgi:hypothetical protein
MRGSDGNEVRNEVLVEMLDPDVEHFRKQLMKGLYQRLPMQYLHMEYLQTQPSWQAEGKTINETGKKNGKQQVRQGRRE